MSKLIIDSIRNELIQVLNKNIQLEEATLAQETTTKNKKDKTTVDKNTSDTQSGGLNSSGTSASPEKSKPTKSVSDILLGTQPSKTPWGTQLGLTDVAGIAAGGKVAGAAGQLLGGKLAQQATNLFGGGQASKLVGGAMGDLFGKAMADAETLSGAPGMEAQIKDIVPMQTKLRWEGAGTPGWFRPLVPKTSIETAEPKTTDTQNREADDAYRAARQQRLSDNELSTREQKQGLPPLPRF
jgi:hypothetical protein